MEKNMNILIVGGGNMGSTLAVRFSQKHNVKLYISNRNSEIDKYQTDMGLFNSDTNTTIYGKIKLITDDMKLALKGVEYVFITYPPSLFQKLSELMLPLLRNKKIVFIPGSGGAELWFRPCLKNGCSISGLQRVHCVARLVEKGKLVKESGIRKSLKIASIPISESKKIAEDMGKLYDLPIEILPNYLNLTLINSNPILHSSRLYSLFKDYHDNKFYDSLPLFYEQWDLDSANLLVQMDKELFEVISELSCNGLDLSGITSILEHYESTNAIELKNKITSIQSFKGLTTPSIKTKKGLIPDFDSRYFTADFNYGLDIILSFAKLCNIKCETLEMVGDWYHSLTQTQNQFNLSNFNISSMDDLKNLYL